MIKEKTQPSYIVCSNPWNIIREEETNIGNLPKHQAGNRSSNKEQKLKCVGDLVKHWEHV